MYRRMCTIFGRTGILRDIVVTCPYLEDFETKWSKLEDFDWWKSVQRGRIVTLDPATDRAGGITHLCKYFRLACRTPYSICVELTVLNRAPRETGSGRICPLNASHLLSGSNVVYIWRSRGPPVRSESGNAKGAPSRKVTSAGLHRIFADSPSANATTTVFLGPLPTVSGTIPLKGTPCQDALPFAHCQPFHTFTCHPRQPPVYERLGNS